MGKTVETGARHQRPEDIRRRNAVEHERCPECGPECGYICDTESCVDATSHDYLRDE